MKRVINCSRSYVLLGHMSRKIATLLIIIHISSPGKKKQACRTYPLEATYPTLSEEETELQLRRRTQTQAQPPKYDPFPCTLLCRMRPGQVAARTMKRKTPDSSRFVCKSEPCRKRPNYRMISRGNVEMI